MYAYGEEAPYGQLKYKGEGEIVTTPSVSSILIVEQFKQPSSIRITEDEKVFQVISTVTEVLDPLEDLPSRVRSLLAEQFRREI